MVKRYKYHALVRLDADEGGGHGGTALPESGGRVVLRARHHQTHDSKMFSALVTGPSGDPIRPAGHSLRLTMTVLGEDVSSYLEAGDSFALWRGHDIGHGVISRRLLFWTEGT